MATFRARITAAAACQARRQGQEESEGRAGSRALLIAPSTRARKSAPASGQGRCASRSCSSRRSDGSGSGGMALLLEVAPKLFQRVAVAAGGGVGRDAEDGA